MVAVPADVKAGTLLLDDELRVALDRRIGEAQLPEPTTISSIDSSTAKATTERPCFSF